MAITPTPWRQGMVCRYIDARKSEHLPPKDSYER